MKVLIEMVTSCNMYSTHMCFIQQKRGDRAKMLSCLPYNRHMCIYVVESIVKCFMENNFLT